MADRPNVLFLLTDDQRFDTIAALGNPQIHTPNLDALVARGVAFTNACIMGGSSGAVCMPSRAMIHTGRTLYGIEREGQTISADHTLLGEHLQRHGYQTFGVGKWHNSPAAYARSFSAGGEIFFGGMNDHWNVPACRFEPSGNYPQHQPLVARWGQNLVKCGGMFDHITPGRHSTDLFADFTADFLRTRTDPRPFFAYLAFMAPHDPREMPSQFLNLYDPDRIDLPPNFLPLHPFDNGWLHIRDEELANFPRTQKETRKHLAEYYAMISHLDARVGDLMRVLEERGQLDNTIVILAGDNGLALGQHGLMGKQSSYDHSVHVPLLMAGPGVPRGERRDALCYLLDIYPTLCDLLQLPTPGTVEGRSLAPVLQDTSRHTRDHLLYALTSTHRAVRDQRWKLIETRAAGAKHTQLFDLAADPWELDNRAADPASAPEIERLRTLLQQWRTDLHDDRPGHGADFWAQF